MLICSKCGKRLGPGRTTCRKCGAPGIPFDIDEGEGVGIPPKVWVQALAAIVIFVLVIGLYKVISARKSETASLTTTEATSSIAPSASPIPTPEVLVMPSAVVPPSSSSTLSPTQVPLFPEGYPVASPSPETTPSPTEDPSAMPDDVRAWLNHLHDVEEERVTLAAAQLTAVTELVRNGSSDEFTAAAVAMRLSWNDLINRFQAEPVPSECSAIRSLFSNTLTGTRTMFADLLGVMRTARQNPGRALVNISRVQDDSDQRVDSPADSTDEAIDALCGRYNTDKWFDINTGVGDTVMKQIGL